MAEAVGLAAAVLGITQVAWEVAKGLHDLADEVGTAGEAVRIFANDFRLFVETMRTLGNLLEELPPVPRRAESTTEELLDVAMEQVVVPFRDLLIELQPLLVKWRDSPSRMRQLSVRIQWAFSCKSKVLFYHSALNALRSNIGLLLQAMSLRGHNPPHVTFIICQSIEDTKSVLLGARGDRAQKSLGARSDPRLLTASATQASASQTFLSTVPIRARSRSQHGRSPSAEMAVVLVTAPEDPEEADEVAEELIRVNLLGLESGDPNEQDEDEQEDQIEAYGAIRAVQKKVIRLADEATTNKSTAGAAASKAAPSTNTPTTSTVGAAVPKAEDRSTAASIDTPTTSTDDQTHQAEHRRPSLSTVNTATSTTSTPQQQETVSNAEPHSANRRLQVDDFYTLDPSEAENLEEAYRLSTEQAIKDEQARQRTKPNEPETSITDDAPITERKEVIHFEDTLGTAFEIPYDLIRTWPAMFAFVISDYQDFNNAPAETRGRYGKDFTKAGFRSSLQAIESGEFSMVYQTSIDDKGELILPHEWDARVKPDWMVYLLLDHENEHDTYWRRASTSPSHTLIRKTHTAAASAAVAGGARGGSGIWGAKRTGIERATTPQLGFSNSGFSGLGLTSSLQPAPAQQESSLKRSRSGIRSKFGL